MATGGDVRIARNGGQGNVKLHPYLVALVRWCVSCVWSTATIVLHRLMTRPLPLAALIPPPSTPKKQRAAGTDHLHPEPKVECVVLHQPVHHQLDVIFVHGLYGSLGNTWRQGDWRPKYKMDPDLVPLIDRDITNCECEDDNEANIYEGEMTFYEDINILPDNNMFITEKFYNNALLDQVEVIDNYEVQAEFVRDLFKKDNSNDCDNICNTNICTFNDVYLNESICKCNVQNVTDCNEVEINEHDDCKCKKINEVELNKRNDEGVKDNYNDVCECKVNENRSCDIGCGCVCDECYSACWPKDWIKEDYPGARVLSINYTSDPYLWRPLWVKENKRLRLHERAEQMTEQLLELDVGQKPIVWVGHSKGGLFIKQIYCEAYEAHLKTQKKNKHTDGDTINYNDNQCNDKVNNENETSNINNDKDYNENKTRKSLDINVNNDKNYNELYLIQDEDASDINQEYNDNRNKNIDERNKNNDFNDGISNDNGLIKLKDNNCMVLNNVNKIEVNGKPLLNNDVENGDIMNIELKSSNSEEDFETRRRGLWSNSIGFMFYSVPHRGSPLADIKTPITARSIELLEISKDCALVLSLQERWLQATSSTKPAVRSVVETTRTLMSVLWLRIVSVHSADAGIGVLNGVSVDHREICKPSSRHCMLYKELLTLIRTALNKCRCQ